MILFLTLVLLFLMITIGGERGAVSIMALAGNIIILFFSVILMSAGFPALLLILAAGAGVCYNSLFYQNGNNVKTRAAFLATLFVMLILFIPIFAITWRTGSYGLNELQISEEDFMYYYNTDISINMLHVAVFVSVFSTLGAVIDTALSVTSSVYEVWTHKNSLVEKELTSTGYQVGKEIIGTTVNTFAFCISWREYFVVFLCCRHKNIVWKSFSIPDSSFRMLRLCYLVLLPVLLQFQYQLNALSGRSDILIQIKSN
ncbi:MAG: YibE/F family protein [Ruminococcus sp.]